MVTGRESDPGCRRLRHLGLGGTVRGLLLWMWALPDRYIPRSGFQKSKLPPKEECRKSVTAGTLWPSGLYIDPRGKTHLLGPWTLKEATPAFPIQVMLCSACTMLLKHPKSIPL